MNEVCEKGKFLSVGLTSLLSSSVSGELELNLQGLAHGSLLYSLSDLSSHKDGECGDNQMRMDLSKPREKKSCQVLSRYLTYYLSYIQSICIKAEFKFKSPNIY